MKKYQKYLIAIVVLLIIPLAVIHGEYQYSRFKSNIIDSAVKDTPGMAPDNTYPVLLIHGFIPVYTKSISTLSLKVLQEEIADTGKYTDKGILTPVTTCAELRYTDNPIIVRASYLQWMNLVEIDHYSNNLGDIVNKIKECTGAKKVDIVAHSMGGIVARNYIQKIDNTSVRKLIMVGTPNHGGLYKKGSLIDILVKNGESKIHLDFVELSENHQFMINLNSGDETPGDIQYYTLAGKIDNKGDGLVKATSVPLDSVAAHNIVDCRHSLLVYPQACPEGFAFMLDSLST
mgnify:CR=1 FL=1|tara:strand:- start:5591 stop:6457 length:867 start_codon:yes stop_codon:yes gene_type:complete